LQQSSGKLKVKRQHITAFWLWLTGAVMVFSLALILAVSVIGQGMEKHVIAFVSNPDRYNKVYLMDVDRIIAAKLSDQTAIACCLSWSPDGRQLAFVADRYSMFEIFIIDADGKALHQLTFDSTYKFYLRWSPDGQQIAFLTSSDLTKDMLDIRVINIDGMQEKEIAETNLRGSILDWSPDGKRILFSSDQNNDYQPEIYTVTLDTNNLQVLSDNGAIYGFSAWAANGTIVFTRDYEIYMMDSDGREILQLTHTTNAVNVNPSLSPDGTHIAFQSDRTGKTEIYLINSDGNNEKQLTFNGVNSSQPFWSHDGSKIIFFSENLFIIDADGSNQRRLTFVAANMSPVWQP
jgi:TolB protein